MRTPRPFSHWVNFPMSVSSGIPFDSVSSTTSHGVASITANKVCYPIGFNQHCAAAVVIAANACILRREGQSCMRKRTCKKEKDI